MFFNFSERGEVLPANLAVENISRNDGFSGHSLPFLGHFMGAIVPAERELVNQNQVTVKISWGCLNPTRLAMAAYKTLHSFFTHSFHVMLACNVTIHLAKPRRSKITNLARILRLCVSLMHVLAKVHAIVCYKKTAWAFDWGVGSPSWN